MNSAHTSLSFANIKYRALEDQRQALLEEYQAASAQLSRTLSDVDRVRLERQLRDLEQRIAKTEADLAALDHPPEIAGEVFNDDSPRGQAGASPTDSGETSSGDVDNTSSASPPAPSGPVEDDPPRLPRKAPIWIWYFVVILLGFVLGVVTDLVDLFGLSRCTGLWLTAALALISGVAILGFSWLPEQRRLHSQKDRIILGVLTLVVTTGVAVYASAKCQPDPAPTVVALRTSHETYVTAWNDEGDRDWRLWGWTDHPDIREWEWFTLECIADGKAAFRTYHQRYVTAMGEDAEWVLRAETDKTQAWELFTLLDAGTGEPLRCQDVIELIQQAEEQQREVSLAIQTDHYGRYVTAKDGEADGDWRIWSDQAETLRDEQKFTVIVQ